MYVCMQPSTATITQLIVGSLPIPHRPSAVRARPGGQTDECSG